MNYTIYDPTSGEILRNIVSDNEQMLQDNLVGQSYIPGTLDSRKFYIVEGAVVEKPKDPSNLLAKYNFNWQTKTWEIDNEKTIQLIRDYRNLLLQDIDRVNPIWYDSLLTEQKTELQQYRQALLDVTTQTGFPLTIQWPQKPTWL